MSDRYWHFVRCDEFGAAFLAHGDGRLVRVGETLTVEGGIALCHRGLHASRVPASALRYCGYPVRLCLVELGGTVIKDESSDKFVASERTVVAMLSLEDTDLLMREFAAWCAMQVAHLWYMPDVVRRYLETHDGELRQDALVACRMPIMDVVGDAARITAFDACLSVPWQSAKTAARDYGWAMALGGKDEVERDGLWAQARAEQNEWLARRALEMLGVEA